MEARLAAPSRSSSSSFSASLQPDFLLELAEELWFCSSVIPFPSIPACFPAFFSSFISSPDTSTLLAQLMFSTTRHQSHSPDPHLPLTSSSRSPSSPSLPPPQQADSQQTPDWSSRKENASYLRRNRGGYNNFYPAGTSYGWIEDLIYCRPQPLGDEHAYHSEDEGLYSLHAKCEHKDANYLAHSDEDTEHVVVMEDDALKEGDCKQDLALSANVSATHAAEDALSALYDVGVLLKDQQYSGMEGDTHEFGTADVLGVMLPKEWPKMTDANIVQADKKSKDTKGSTHVEACRETDAACSVPYVGHDNSLILLGKPACNQLMLDLSCTKQDEMKEHLKYWARVVASDLCIRNKQRCKQGKIKGNT